MSETKFTPGPWAYEIVPSDRAERLMPKSEWSGLYIGPLDEETGRLAHTIFEGGFAHGPSDGDPEADAQLMSAAPDLYEALENVPLPSTQGGWGEFVPRFYNWLNGQRDAALAKATGDAQESDMAWEDEG